MYHYIIAHLSVYQAAVSVHRLFELPRDIRVLEIIPICRENDVILVIDDNVELVKELRVHGVHIGKGEEVMIAARG